MLNTSTFTRPSVAVLAVSLIIIFSFLGCRQTPGPVIPDPHSKWLLSKVTRVSESVTQIFELTYNSSNRPSLIKQKSVYKSSGDTIVSIDRMVYDNQQRLIAITDTSQVLDTITVISYDANGRIKEVAPPPGPYLQKTIYEYFDNNKAIARHYYNAIYEDTVIDTRTFIYDQEGNLVEDTLIASIIHTGVLDGYDTVPSKYAQYDHHPNPAAFTNTNIDLDLLLYHGWPFEPFITSANYQKKTSTSTDPYSYLSQVEIYTYQYNEAGLVKGSVIETTTEYSFGTFTGTETYKYEYIKAN